LSGIGYSSAPMRPVAGPDASDEPRDDMATTTTDTTTRHDSAEHVHGNADIRAHERTFEAFVKFLAWNAVGAIVLLVFLALVNA